MNITRTDTGEVIGTMSDDYRVAQDEDLDDEPGEDLRVALRINAHQGYSAAQISDPMTLGDLRSLIDAAIGKYGEDTPVVTDDGQRYGAQFGSIDRYADITAAGEEEE